jgi:hypothetical protein
VSEQHSHNGAAHDVDLDASLVDEVVERMLTRAETVDGERGRAYLAERISNLKDAWNRAKAGSARLGYERQTVKQVQLAGLLRKPGEGPWQDTTVGLSMRETENEINLLVPGQGQVFEPVYNAPPWIFGEPGAGEDEDGSEGDDISVSELGPEAEGKNAS